MGTLGIKAISPDGAMKAVQTLGGIPLREMSKHSHQMVELNDGRVRVPNKGGREIGRSTLGYLIADLEQSAGVPDTLIQAAFHDAGCTWYGPPPVEARVARTIIRDRGLDDPSQWRRIHIEILNRVRDLSELGFIHE